MCIKKADSSRFAILLGKIDSKDSFWHWRLSNCNPELGLTMQTINKLNLNAKGAARSWTSLKLNAFFLAYGKVLNTREHPLIQETCQSKRGFFELNKGEALLAGGLLGL
jgi:hypothetical protein